MLFCVALWMTGIGGAMIGMLAGACAILIQHAREADPISELVMRLRHPFQFALVHPVRAARSCVEKRRGLR